MSFSNKVWQDGHATIETDILLHRPLDKRNENGADGIDLNPERTLRKNTSLKDTTELIATWKINEVRYGRVNQAACWTVSKKEIM